MRCPKGYISGTELRIVIHGSDDARKSLLKRAFKEGYLEVLKRDLYLIKNIPNKPAINSFEVAQFIYGPSYISFESALRYFDWIPESVPITTSATIKQTRQFSTGLGIFSFEKIPNRIFSCGVKQINERGEKFLIADPWKAILDMVYFRHKKWDNAEELMEDLRIEPENILNSHLEVLHILSQEYPHKPTRTVAMNILNSIHSLKGE